MILKPLAEVQDYSFLSFGGTQTGTLAFENTAGDEALITGEKVADLVDDSSIIPTVTPALHAVIETATVSNGIRTIQSLVVQVYGSTADFPPYDIYMTDGVRITGNYSWVASAQGVYTRLTLTGTSLAQLVADGYRSITEDDFRRILGINAVDPLPYIVETN